MIRDICDLHTHSTASDGTDSPRELIELAEEAGLYAVALSDHNTVGGLPEFLHCSAGLRVKAIPAVEFSTDYLDTELHIIAHGVRPESYSRITEYVSQLGKRKIEANRELAQRLCDGGYKVDYEKIYRESSGIVNRVHFAAALVEGGYVRDAKEAFSTLLSEEMGYYRRIKRLDAIETVDFIKDISAVATLAHPYLNLDDAGIRGFLSLAVPRGLDAMEVYYSTYTKEEEELARRAARDFSLIESGGSDYHGSSKPDIKLGVGRGDLSVPRESCERILERLGQL